jgi:excisionase family DNA binding protein
MRKRRHHLQLEDFQNVVTYCEGCDGSILGNLLRSCDMAKLLHVSPMTVYTWVNKGNVDIPHVRIGGRRGVVRFPKAWLFEWARKRGEALRKWNFDF